MWFLGPCQRESSIGFVLITKHTIIFSLLVHVCCKYIKEQAKVEIPISNKLRKNVVKMLEIPQLIYPFLRHKEKLFF